MSQISIQKKEKNAKKQINQEIKSIEFIESIKSSHRSADYLIELVAHL
jgi:hypothetical protein